MPRVGLNEEAMEKVLKYLEGDRRPQLKRERKGLDLGVPWVTL